MYIQRYVNTIKPEEKVVDLGSGNDPCPRADVYVDYFVEDNTHRSGNDLIKPSTGTFIEWDLNKYPYPFKDKEFDFVICAHIAEHIEDPLKFTAELQRIGKRGYIETPSKLYEEIFGWDFHLWQVYELGDELVFERKTEASPFTVLGKKLYGTNKVFSTVHDKQIEKLLTSFYWEDSFKVRVIDPTKTPKKQWKYITEKELDMNPTTIEKRLPFFIRKALNTVIKND